MMTAPQADAMMKALKGAGLDIPVIGGPTLASAIPLFAQGTKNVDGMYFISTAVTAGPQLPDSYPGKPMIAGMYEAVMAETKAPPDTFAGLGCRRREPDGRGRHAGRQHRQGRRP